MSRLQEAISRIDAANASDPNRVQGPHGPVAKELLYGQRMSTWLAALEPDASEELRLACRASHIRRWESARSDFPEGRAGYKQWRSQLLKFHAATALALLQELGYSAEQGERVAAIIQKQKRTQDAEVQTLEDVACLVFLEFEFVSFMEQHEQDKLIPIVQKTWAKMSPQAHQRALALELPARARHIIETALEQA